MAPGEDQERELPEEVPRSAGHRLGEEVMEKQTPRIVADMIQQ
ncbi:hypothetical protein GCM10010392_69110 [Streptomyces clavifer]|nr:hypothetical protein GCM10010392_69110 [Streptomyces clavifer]